MDLSFLSDLTFWKFAGFSMLLGGIWDLARAVKSAGERIADQLGELTCQLDSIIDDDNDAGGGRPREDNFPRYPHLRVRMRPE